MEIRTVTKVLMWLSCWQIAFAIEVTIPLNVSGTEAYRTNPAQVAFLETVTLICTQGKTAVFNVNRTQYESCSYPVVHNFQNIHIGDCGDELFIYVAENILQTAVNYKLGETFYYAVYFVTKQNEIVGSEPCEEGIKFKLLVVDRDTLPTTLPVDTSTTAPETTILGPTPTPTVIHTRNMTYSITSRLSTTTALSVSFTTVVQSSKSSDSLRTLVPSPISSGIAESDNTGVVPVYVIGAIVGGILAVAVAIVVLVALGIVIHKKRRTSRTISITPAKERFIKREKLPDKNFSAPCATNRLSYDFMDNMEQINGVSTFGRDSEGLCPEEHKIDLSRVSNESNFV